MRVLLFTIALFFALSGGAAIYFASADAGHEYDLKFVLPVDARHMPVAAPAPNIAGSANEEPPVVTEGRAETPEALREADKLIGDEDFKFTARTEGAAAQ